MTAHRPTHAVALLVAGAFFMENLDGTVIATALPPMARSFGSAPEALGIGMSAYLLTLAVFIPASGWVADRFGARRVFAGAIVVFTLASILCGLSTGRTSFVLARIAQGLGGALMTPVGRLVVLRGTSKTDLVHAIAVLTWPALVAPVIGPPVGGFIAGLPPAAGIASWRWIFLLNVPLGMVALAFTFRLIPAAASEAVRRFDTTGFLLNGLTLAAVLYGFDLVGRPDGSLATAAAILAASLGIGWLAVRHARRHPSPLVALAAFAVPSFRVTMVGGGLSRVVISTLPFLLPLLLQVGLGFSTVASGLLVLWYGLTNLGIKPATTPLIRAFGFRTVLITNTLVNAAAIGACALIGPGTPLPVIAALLALAGASRSMQFTALNTLAFAEVSPEQTSGANTLFNIMFQFATGMGIALGAIALRVTSAAWLGASTSAATAVPVAAFHAAFVVIAALGLLPLVDIFRLRRDAGHVVSGFRGRSATAPGRAAG